MKKLTKKQHRGIIKGLVAKNEDVKELRIIQQVAEFFQEEEDTCEEGMEFLTTAEAVRLLLHLVNAGLGSKAYEALYGVLEDQDRERDEIDDILEVLEMLDERRVHLVHVHAMAIAGLIK